MIPDSKTIEADLKKHGHLDPDDCVYKALIQWYDSHNYPPSYTDLMSITGLRRKQIEYRLLSLLDSGRVTRPRTGIWIPVAK